MQRPQRHATGDADEQQHGSHRDLPHRPTRGGVQRRHQQGEVLLPVSRVQDRDAAEEEQVGEEWEHQGDATASSRGLVAPAVREHQVCRPAGQRPEREQLGQVGAQQRAHGAEQQRADQRLEARMPRLAAPGDAMPAQDADEAQLDHRQRNHRQVVGVQHDVDLEVLERGRPVETDVGGQVDIGGGESRRPFRQPPAHEQRGSRSNGNGEAAFSVDVPGDVGREELAAFLPRAGV